MNLRSFVLAAPLLLSLLVLSGSESDRLALPRDETVVIRTVLKEWRSGGFTRPERPTNLVCATTISVPEFTGRSENYSHYRWQDAITGVPIWIQISPDLSTSYEDAITKAVQLTNEVLPSPAFGLVSDCNGAVDSLLTGSTGSDIERLSVVQISRPGIDSRSTRAMLYLGYSLGGIATGGSLVLLEKHDGTWTVLGSAELWVS